MRALAAAVLLGLCAAGAAISAEPSPTEAAFAGLRDLEQRVAAVAFRLSIANAELCPQTGPQTGLTLHDAAQYGPAARAGAVRYFHLTDAPAVLAIAPGSPAERAGLQPDDALLALNGAPLAAPPAGGGASYEPLDAAWARLNAGLARGENDLLIQRAGRPLNVRLQPVMGCAYRVQVVPSTRMNATANPQSVSITTALARYAANENDLALVVAHELAHEVLRHPAAASRKKERQADYIGAYLAARAGYDLAGAPAFLRRFGQDTWAMRLGAFSHPGPRSRARAVEAAAAEIARKRAAGLPLKPGALP